MALRTPVSAAEARRAMAAYGLKLEELEALPAHGTVNSNFRVRASGKDWFLRLNEGKEDADVEREAQLVTALRRGGLPTPEVMCTLEGGWFISVSERPATLFPWIQGREAAPRHDAPDSVRVCGKALALLHRAGGGLERASLPRNHYSLDELQRRLESFAADPRLVEVAPKLRLALSRAGQLDLPSGLIHQDLFPDNLLIDERGDLVAVLDLEQACWGAFAYDVAVAVNAWCWDGARIVPELASALLGEYGQLRKLTPRERVAFVELARLAAARFTITRITDVFLREGVDADLKRRKDYRDYFARLGFWSSASSFDFLKS